MYKITKEMAKQFILRKQGLLGKHQFHNEIGVLEYVKQVGCLQFDPIDICGRNMDLVLYSRVSNYNKKMLDDLLYKSRDLVDQWDKNMSVYSIDDWSKLSRIRKRNAEDYENRLSDQLDLTEKVKMILDELDYVQSSDLDIMDDSSFYTWRSKKLSQTILDYLFFKGDAIIHHRDGVKRYFGKADKYLNNDFYYQEDPFFTLEEFHMFQIKRRIGALGMLGSGPSDAYLGIYDLSTAKRREHFKKLIASKDIIELSIEGLKDSMYILKEDEHLLKDTGEEKRLEFIAPLDNFLWDRKLIAKVFDFSYTWEIYMKAETRIYGAYVMPILYGSDLVGRIEITTDKKNGELILKNLWFQNDSIDDDFWIVFEEKVNLFAGFNNCSKINKENFKIHK